MLQIRCFGLRKLVDLLAGVMLLGFAASVSADPKPLTKEEQAKVDKAIERGIRFLKRAQRPSGAFPREVTGISSKHFPFVVGQTVLPALALLECGVAPDDPCVQKTALLLRKHASKLESTYELSLVLMFLDRLGERQDEETIRSLALRLVAGQCYTGGWSYRCPHLTTEQEADLLKALRALQKNLGAVRPAPREGAKQGEAKAAPEVPASLAKLAVFQNPSNLFVREEVASSRVDRPVFFAGGTDNSNTQFATLALWAARRHDLPLIPTFRLIVRRFECSQSADGTWSYAYRFGGAIRQTLPATNTGAGLLGLAIGCAEIPTEKNEQTRREKQIVYGLAVLSGVIGDPTELLVLRKDDESNYYILCTIERVAALDKLQEVGRQDWYRWGA